MLPRTRRIPTSQFLEVITRGSSYHSPHFGLKVVKKSGKTSAFAVSVSKKVSTKAVTRNLIKRRAYHVIRKSTSLLHPGLRCVIMAKKGLTELPFSEFEAELRSLLVQAGVIFIE